MSFAKNTAHDIPFSLISNSTGAVLTGEAANITAYRSLDGGAQAAVAGSISEAGNGQYVFEGAAADFNADWLVGLLFTHASAVYAHVLVQMNRLRKGTAYTIPFVMNGMTTGQGLTGLSPAGKRVLDGGAQASVSGSFSELGNGQYAFAGAVADFNADDAAGFLFTAAGAIPAHLTVDIEPAIPSDGDSLIDEVYSVLAADAQINNASNLGGMLAQTSAEPYGVYFRNPPEGANFDNVSVLTFFINSMAGRQPRDQYLAITAWGDNFRDILDRCYALLHEKKLTPTDFKLMALLWDSALPESYSEDHKTYFQQHRYLMRTWKM